MSEERTLKLHNSVKLNIHKGKKRVLKQLTSRWPCCMSPCKTRAPGSNPASSEAASLVSVKMIVRPPLNQKHTFQYMKKDLHTIYLKLKIESICYCSLGKKKQPAITTNDIRNKLWSCWTGARKNNMPNIMTGLHFFITNQISSFLIWFKKPRRNLKTRKVKYQSCAKDGGKV